jgi:hypothetical protein
LVCFGNRTVGWKHETFYSGSGMPLAGPVDDSGIYWAISNGSSGMPLAGPVETHAGRYHAGASLVMPLAGPMETHAVPLHSCYREPPRGQLVASVTMAEA